MTSNNNVTGSVVPLLSLSHQITQVLIEKVQHSVVHHLHFTIIIKLTMPPTRLLPQIIHKYG